MIAILHHGSFPMSGVDICYLMLVAAGPLLFGASWVLLTLKVTDRQWAVRCIACGSLCFAIVIGIWGATTIEKAPIRMTLVAGMGAVLAVGTVECIRLAKRYIQPTPQNDVAAPIVTTSPDSRSNAAVVINGDYSNNFMQFRATGFDNVLETRGNLKDNTFDIIANRGSGPTEQFQPVPIEIRDKLKAASLTQIGSKILVISSALRIMEKKVLSKLPDLKAASEALKDERQEFRLKYFEEARNIESVLLQRLQIKHYVDDRPTLLSHGIASGKYPFNGAADYLDKLLVDAQKAEAKSH